MQGKLLINPFFRLVSATQSHYARREHQEVDLRQSANELCRSLPDVPHESDIALDKLMFDIFPFGLWERRNKLFGGSSISPDDDNVSVAVAVLGEGACHAGTDSRCTTYENGDRAVCKGACCSSICGAYLRK